MSWKVPSFDKLKELSVAIEKANEIADQELVQQLENLKRVLEVQLKEKTDNGVEEG